jgi:ATP-binding cassette, subfamily B, bacterial CvaB/MchF/RaxB
MAEERMSALFSIGRSRGTLPDIRQTEVAECGLACLAMISEFHGRCVELAALRRRYPVSLAGTTLRTVLDVAARIGLVGRPLRLEPPQLRMLRMPAILHWGMSHFVVLKHVGRKHVTIHDPAAGVRRFTFAEVSKQFTGVALELTPGEAYVPERSDRLRVTELFGALSGLPAALLQVLVLSLVLQIYVLASPFLLQLAVDDVIAQGDAEFMLVLACGFGLAVLINAVAAILRARILCHVQSTLAFQMGTRLYRHLMYMPLLYFERRHIGDLVSRFYAADPIRGLMSEGLIAVVVDGAMAVLTMAMTFLYSVTLAFVVLLALAFYIVLRLGFYRLFRRRSLDLVIAKARESTTFIETVRAIQSIKLFGRQNERCAVWANRYAEVVQADTAISGMKQVFVALNDLVFGLENIVVIYLGAHMALRGQMTAGMLMAFVLYKQQFVDKATRLVEKAIEFRMLDLHLERLADIMRTEREPERAREATYRPTVAGAIEVSGLSFRYSSSEPVVFDNVSFTVAPGDYVAISGPSGCGKSTLLKVMLGLLPPASGEVRYDGTLLPALGAATVRDAIAVVMQDDHLLTGSIADNICFFDEMLDPELMKRCAEIAGVHEEIMRMPMAYDSLVGDMGSSLSGGQKQRILLARALYKRPKILFMDEGTSHLDIAMERRVTAAIKELGLTRVIIAHRPETIASAERWLVLGRQGIVVAKDSRSAQCNAQEVRA